MEENNQNQTEQNNEPGKAFRELKDILKKEGRYLFYLFVALCLIFKIVFYQENILVLLRTVLGIFWLFVIPGLAIMYYWADKFDFLERLIFGTVLGIAIVGLSSYYLTLFKLNLHWQYLIIPIVMLTVSGIMVWRKLSKPKDL